MEKVISTVSTIFKQRYGTQLVIERTYRAQKDKPLFMSHWRSPFVYSRTLRQVSFPIFNSKKELQAIATASPVENKDAIIFDEMAQFLQLTIAEHLELTERKEIQLQQELALARSTMDRSKVIDLKTKKTNSETITFQYKKIDVEEIADLRPIWISSENENFNAHIAFSVHDWAAHWAFINAKEIPDLIWQDPHAWRNFPNVTIFIPNINSLSQENIDRLTNNIRHLKFQTDAKPLIIVSSDLELSPELIKLRSQFKHYKANKNISARVQAHFLLYHYKEDKPWSYHDENTKGVYFLPLSNKPTHFH
jgi:hypothetical protein